MRCIYVLVLLSQISNITAFLWRGLDQDRAPDVYEFDRVVFGVSSSPFQAQFVLLQHAKQYQSEYPRAAETILKSTYMDDSIDSVLNEEEGEALYKELSALLAKAGMHARNWLYSSSRVLQEIPQLDRKSEVDLDKESLPTAKTLGVWWLAGQDVFTFRENAPDENMKYTKRNFLKKIATLFDPLGLLAPFTVRAKILLQDMWTAGLEWDEEMDESLSNSARTWFAELHDLKQLKIPRCLQETEQVVKAVNLHTFVDASEGAYGAGSVSTNIVAAKTRVAPSVATSIPRLEFMAAVIGVRLTSKISTSLEIPISRTIV